MCVGHFPAVTQLAGGIQVSTANAGGVCVAVAAQLNKLEIRNCEFWSKKKKSKGEMLTLR